MRKIDSTGYLSGIISLSAKLLTDLSRANAALSCYPHLKRISNGSTSSYLLRVDGINDRFYIIKVSRGAISITLHSKSSPLYFIKEHLLRSFSIILALSEDYRVDLAPLLPYLIEALNREYMPVRKDQYDSHASTDKADELLSRRVIGLLNECNALNTTIGKLETVSVSLTSKLILQRYASGYDAEGIASELCIEPEMVSRSIKNLEAAGYRALPGKGRTFELVKA